MALLDHVGVRVTDLDRAIAFYTEMFGFEMVERRMLTGNDHVESAALKVSEDSLVFLLANPAFTAQPTSVEARPEHFCLTFEPAEFEGIVGRLRAAGALDRPEADLRPRSGATGRSPSVYVLDPDNNQIEVKSR
jgi:catechol 2,3-dioxygenase-like lactoylglutathione lyase family enzyme